MIIAEIGVNHLGSEEYANSYLKQLCESSVDGITFQIREPLFYNSESTRGLKLSKKFYHSAIEKIHCAGKQAGIAIADFENIDFCESLKVDFYKVIRNDLNNKELLQMLFDKSSKTIYISTGMSSTDEIDNMTAHFAKYIERVCLIHTQLSYAVKDANLNAMTFLQKRYKVPVGFGSHCSNNNVIYTALAFNPASVWFYVKGKSNKTHPDDKHAILLSDVRKVVSNINELRSAFGSFQKNKMKNLIEE